MHRSGLWFEFYLIIQSFYKSRRESESDIMQVFHWGRPVGNYVVFESREQCLQGRLGLDVVSRPVGESR